MANLILVPAHDRPECLWLCLESLRQCRGIEKYPLCIAWGGDSDPEIPAGVEKVCQGFDYEVYVHPPGWFSLRSYGEKMKHAFAKSDDFVMVVEEDQEVSKDFLEVMEYAAKNFRDERLLAIITGGVDLPRGYVEADDELLWLCHSFFLRGDMIFKQAFKRYVEPYLSEEFYQTERVSSKGIHSYDGNFPKIHFPSCQVDAISLDGLFGCVVKEFNLYTLQSVIPRSHVTGFVGMHMQPITNEGWSMFRNHSLEDRVAFMKGAILTGAIKQFFGKWAIEYRSLEDDHSWSKLRVRSEGMY